MSEPLLPVPPPEPDSNWDPEPARCECGEIIAVRPDGKGWCQFHGMVTPVYGKRHD